MLEFNIRNQEISRIDNFSPAEKSVEYLIAKFNFKTEDWNDTAKTATFKNLKTKKEYDKIIEDNQCKVPWEVLEGNSDIEVSVFGVNGAYTITTDVACFKLNRTLSGGSASTEPTPSAYAQYVKYVAEERQKAESAATKAEEFAKKAEDASEGKSIDVDNKLSEESTNPIQNKVITAEVIALRERNAELEETIEKLQIKTTTSPFPFHHITDSANMKVVDFGMEGKTEQKTTEGKNLFDVDDFKACETLSVLGSGVNWGYKLNVVAGQTYTFNRNNSDGYNVEGLATSRIADGSGNMIVPLLNKWTESENKASVSFTAVDETYLAFNAGNTVSKIQELFDTYFINPQLELGSVATEYEPFTNGPSPNPEYEQPITLAGVYNEETGRYEIGCGVENENLFVVSALISGFYLDQYNGNAVASDNYYMSDYISVQNPLYKYIVFYGDLTKKRIIYYDKNKQYIKGNGENTIDFYSLMSSDTEYFRYSFYCEDIGRIWEKEIIIERSNTMSPSEYVEGKSQQFTLTSPVPLTKWDKLVKRDGVWGWSVWQLPLTVTGNSKIYAYIVGKGFIIQDVLRETFMLRDGICNQYRIGTNDTLLGVNSNMMKIGTNNAWIYTFNDSFYDETLDDSGVANWKAHLNEHPLEIITYSDTEQAFIPLPDEEQTLLNNLETYYGVTNVYNEQGCPMWLTYVNDTKLYVDQKLLEIQQAII